MSIIDDTASIGQALTKLEGRATPPSIPSSVTIDIASGTFEADALTADGEIVARGIFEHFRVTSSLELGPEDLQALETSAFKILAYALTGSEIASVNPLWLAEKFWVAMARIDLDTFLGWPLHKESCTEREREKCAWLIDCCALALVEAMRPDGTIPPLTSRHAADINRRAAEIFG